MQEIFVILIVLAAIIYLCRYIYKHLIARDNKCSGCAVYKLHHMKMEQQKSH